VQVSQFGIGEESVEAVTVTPLDNDECLTRVGIAELSGMLYVHPEHDDAAAVARHCVR